MLPKSIVKEVMDMKEQVSLIRTFPLILDDLPDYVNRLEDQYRWRLNEKPSVILRTWESQKDSKLLFYFLGWFTESVNLRGVGNMRYLTLREKRALTRFIDSILEEANNEELDSFNKGRNDTSYFSP